jgi:nucleoid-associated protein YgaU
LTSNKRSRRIGGMARPRASLRRAAVAAVVVVLGVLGWSSAAAGDAAASHRAGASAGAAERIYVVRQGDTLWSIAVGVGSDSDPRAVVDAIARANGIDGATLVPGQALIIPADLG